MQHASHVGRYPGTLAELATELGDLRYDALAAFLTELAAKLEADSLADGSRGRQKLAATLQSASEGVATAAERIAKAWQISAPHM